MLVALISARECAREEPQVPLATMRAPKGGILRRQIEFALELGCKRIVCLASSPAKPLIELQLLAEKRGADFIIASHNHALAGAVTSADRLLVLAEGVVFASGAIDGFSGDKSTILALPASLAVPLGFERIDRERAWAGVMIVRGSLVEKLHDLPPDIDSISSLLRLGLQSAASVVMIDEAALTGKRWELVRTEEHLRLWQSRAAADALKPASWKRPIYSLIDRLVLCTGSVGVHTRASMALGAGGIALAAMCVVLAIYGFAAAGLLIVVLAALVIRIGRDCAELTAIPCNGRARKRLFEIGQTLAIDIALATGAVLAAATDFRPDMIFASATLFGLLHLSAMQGAPDRILCLQDRALLAVALAFGAIFGVVSPIVQTFALFALASELYFAARARLTAA